MRSPTIYVTTDLVRAVSTVTSLVLARGGAPPAPPAPPAEVILTETSVAISDETSVSLFVDP